jgi:hypothetical protein
LFLPSTQKFPIKSSLPVSLEPWLQEQFRCNKCDNWRYHNDLQFSSSKKEELHIYDLYDQAKLAHVCAACNRLVYFQIGNFISSYKNLDTKSKYDWLVIKKDLRSKYKLHIASYLYKRLRQERYSQLGTYNWESYFESSPMTLDFILDKISELTRKEFCVDNIRVAFEDNKTQMRRYNKQKNTGCCGSSDNTVFCWFRMKNIKIGFNYGH